MSIKYRIILSYLLLIITALGFPCWYLLDTFYQKNLEEKTHNLVTNARLIELTLEEDLNHADRKIRTNDDIRRLSDTAALRVTLLDAAGSVLADSWENPSGLENHSDREEIKNALYRDYATSIRYSHTISQNMLYVAVPVYKDGILTGIVRTATTLQPIESAYSEIRQVILTALLGASMLAILLGIWLAHINTKSIRKMTAAAQRIADGNLAERISLKSGDELEILANTLNNLTANLTDKIQKIETDAKKLSFILENMDNAVILLDHYGNVVDANQHAQQTFHIHEEMYGKHSIGVLGDSALTEAAHKVLAAKQPTTIQLTTKINNTRQTYQVFLAPLITAVKNINGVLSVFHNITILQENYERQVDFVSNASHELKTPLTAIQGFSETLLDGALEDPALSRKFITIIHAEAERMNRLVEALLLLAKLDSAEYRKRVKIEELDVAAILKTVQYQLSPQFEGKKQQFLIDVPAQPLFVQANYDWLLQVVINVAENAIKYTPNGGKIELIASFQPNAIQIIVKDSGIGIPPDSLPFIFERFYRADKARTRSAGGSGLGLSIVRFIVELLGGTIRAESKSGAGTSFVITLPKTDEKKEP